MTTDPRIRHDKPKGRQPSVSLACSANPTPEQIEALAGFISSQHPDWSLNYCELRAMVEFQKRAT